MSDGDWLDAIPTTDGEFPEDLHSMGTGELLELVRQAAQELRVRRERKRLKDRWREGSEALKATLTERLVDYPGWLVLHGDLLMALEYLEIPEADFPEVITDLYDLIGEMPDGVDPDPAADSDRGVVFWREFFSELENFVNQYPRTEEPSCDDGEDGDHWYGSPWGIEEDEEITEEPAAEETVHPGPRSQEDLKAITQQMRNALDEMAIGERYAEVRLGLDFGTSRSKLRLRMLGMETPLAEPDEPEVYPSAIAFDRNSERIWFGAEAQARFEAEPLNTFYQRSLKTALLQGGVPGISGVHKKLTSYHVALFTFAWLMQQARRNVQASMEAGEGGWLDVNLTTPVAGPYKTLRPFWSLNTAPAGVTYRQYLKYLAAGGAALAGALDWELPSEWGPLWALSDRLRGEERLSKVIARRPIEVTSEPMAALANYSDPELEDGLHLFLDSGAGTTDWVVLLKHGSHRLNLAMNSVPFGGDRVDEAMLKVVLDDPDLSPEARAQKELIRLRLNESKAEFFEYEDIDFNPNDLVGISGALPVGVSIEEVDAVLEPYLNELHEKLASTIGVAEERIVAAEDNLKKIGAGAISLRDFRRVHLLGGNAHISSLRDHIESAFTRFIGEVPPIEPLDVPLSEVEAGRTNPERYRTSAVALGASGKDLPSSELLKADTHIPRGVSITDKSAV